MAFEELRSLITQNVRTNGTESITGAIMQNVLLQMVNELGAWTGGGGTPYATQDWVNQQLLNYATIQALGTKQDMLTSGTNIKTINNQSILGSGNIDIQGGGGGDYLPLAGGTMTGAIEAGSLSEGGYSLHTNSLELQYSHNGAVAYVQQIIIDAPTQTIGFYTRNGLVVGTLISGESVTTNSFIKRGGTASQFLKADGSVDSNSYLPLTGGVMAGSINFISSAYGINFSDGSQAMGDIGWNSLYEGLSLHSNRKIVLDSSTIWAEGNLTATSFIKDGGTASQFLKADGSVDDNSYLPLTGGTMTGSINFTSSAYGINFSDGSQGIGDISYNSLFDGLSLHSNRKIVLESETIWAEGNLSAESYHKFDSNNNEILCGGGGVKALGNVGGTWLGVCSTAASTSAKTVNLSDFILYPKVTISVRFTSAINVPDATLNVNSTGAKPIYINGNPLQYGVINAGMTAIMQYDGTNWNIVSLMGVEQGRTPENTVDLGLPSGLLWATKNVDVTKVNKFAENEYAAGSYFSWGNQEGHNPTSQGVFSYDFGTSNDGPYANTIGARVTANLSPQMDMARANLGAPWRLPTKDDFQELRDNCTWTWVVNTPSGIPCYSIVSNINQRVLYIPAAGLGYGTSLDYLGSNGYYWSSSFLSSAFAYGLDFNSGAINPQNSFSRFFGFSVRAVQ